MLTLFRKNHDETILKYDIVSVSKFTVEDIPDHSCVVIPFIDMVVIQGPREWQEPGPEYDRSIPYVVSFSHDVY